jgi:thiol-disulfide isomerase/thioredoxin
VSGYDFTATMRSARPAILVLLGAMLVFSGDGRAQGKNPPAKPNTADPAVIDLHDYQKLLETHRGKPLLVNFWATWCEPCRDEFPMLNELARAYGPRGLQVLGVSLDEDVDINLVRRFLARMNPVFSNFRKKPGKDEEFINGVHVKWSGALPATFFYDREGRMAATLVGEHSRPEFDKVIQQLLQSASPAAAGAARRSVP